MVGSCDILVLPLSGCPPHSSPQHHFIISYCPIRPSVSGHQKLPRLSLGSTLVFLSEVSHDLFSSATQSCPQFRIERGYPSTTGQRRQVPVNHPLHISVHPPARVCPLCFLSPRGLEISRAFYLCGRLAAWFQIYHQSIYHSVEFSSRGCLLNLLTSLAG